MFLSEKSTGQKLREPELYTQHWSGGRETTTRIYYSFPSLPKQSVPSLEIYLRSKQAI